MFIESMMQVGMFDPYPEDFMEVNFSIPDIHKEIPLVYREERYIKGNSPNSLYIPSKLVLFKIMRACIGILDKNKLWF